MSGCFGSSKYDRHLQAQLDKYLDSTDIGPDEEQCHECGKMIPAGECDEVKKINDLPVCNDCFEELREDLQECE